MHPFTRRNGLEKYAGKVLILMMNFKELQAFVKNHRIQRIESKTQTVIFETGMGSVPIVDSLSLVAGLGGEVNQVWAKGPNYKEGLIPCDTPHSMHVSVPRCVRNVR